MIYPPQEQKALDPADTENFVKKHKQIKNKEKKPGNMEKNPEKDSNITSRLKRI